VKEEATFVVDEMRHVLRLERLSKTELSNEFTSLLIDAASIYGEILEACGGYVDSCGSYLFDPVACRGYSYDLRMYQKQYLLRRRSLGK
jgi:hypothetical protein